MHYDSVHLPLLHNEYNEYIMQVQSSEHLFPGSTLNSSVIRVFILFAALRLTALIAAP
jgi:hypothetical protein